MWKGVLDEVTINARRKFIKTENDRIIYNIQDDEVTKTLPLIESLRRIHMITVDGSGNIHVNGSSSYKIYRNGHEDASLTQNAKNIFKTMPSSIVKRIEVITEPGAREDAEGVDAVLNFVMIDENDFNNITGRVFTSIDTDYSPWLGGNLTTQVGKAIVDFNIGYSHMTKEQSKAENDKELTFDNSGNTILSHMEGTNPGDIFSSSVNASYDIDSLNLLSASANFETYKLDAPQNYIISMNDRMGNTIYRYRQNNFFPNYQFYSAGGRLDYEHRTKYEGETLTLSYMFSATRKRCNINSQLSEIYGNTPFGYEGYYYKTFEKNINQIIQLSWVRPLDRHQTIGTGAKYIHRTNKSNCHQEFNMGTGSMEMSDPAESLFNHTTNIASFYIDYHLTAGRFYGRAGLRFEHNLMDIRYPNKSEDNFSQSLNDWIPHVSATYKFNDVNSLKLGYKSSITRPGIEYLNPAKEVNHMDVYYGNSRLTNTRDNTFYLEYWYGSDNLNLNIEPSFSFHNRGIGEFNYAADDILMETFDNAEHYECIRLQGGISWSPFKGTLFNLNGDIHHKYIEYPAHGLKQSAWACSYMLLIEQKLPWKLWFTFNTTGMGGHNLENVYAYSTSGLRYMTQIRRSFCNDRLSVTLSAEMPFHNYYREKSHITVGNYKGFECKTTEEKNFLVSLSYQLGKSQIRTKKTNTTVEDDYVKGSIKPF